MREEEARKIIAVLMVTYPNYKPIDTDLAVKTWTGAMEEYSYECVSTALKAYIRSDSSGFAPTPGQLIDKIQNMIVPEELNEMEAWALVSKAIRNGGYNSAFEFAKLPPLVQKAVGLPDQLRIWALDKNYSEDVVSSNFIKCYRAVSQKEKDAKKLPREVRMVIENTNKDSHAAHIESLRAKLIENMALREKRGNMAIEEHTDVCGMPSKCKEHLNALFEE